MKNKMELYNTNKRKYNDEENRGYKFFLLLLDGGSKEKRKRKIWMEITMVTVYTMAARPAATELAPKIMAGIPALTLPGH